MTAYLWLRCFRRPWSQFLNWMWKSECRPLPRVNNLFHIQQALKLIGHKSDRYGDWIQKPELTWGRKKGDCEDLARLAQALLAKIGVQSFLLSVILKPGKYSHAVCVYQDVAWRVISNGILNPHGYEDLEEIIKSVAGKNKLTCWSLEDQNGKIIQIKRGVL
jgi:hypothetical protein